MAFRIDGFKQIEAFYEWVFNNPDKARPTHVSLYLFLWNQGNRSKWVEWFKCPYDLAMQGACIGNNGTYYKCLAELKSFGLIDYKKGINNFKAPLINLKQLYNSEQLTVPQCEQQTEQQYAQQYAQLPVHIYNYITNNIKLITDNENKILTFFDSLKNNNKENNIYRKFAHLSITNEEVEKLKENYTIEQIDDVIDKIENYAKNKNYKSLYLTAINWLKKEQNTKKENKVIIELRKLIPECKTKRELEKLTYFADIILESNELKNKFFDCGLQTLLDVFELAGAFIANWELDFKEQILKYDNKDSSKSISTIINKIKNRYV